MSKKSSWLCLIKSFFFSKPHHHQQQGSKRRRRWLFGRLKRTQGLLPSPPPPPPSALLPVQAEKVEHDPEEQSKREDDNDDVSKPTLECVGHVLMSTDLITLQTHGLCNADHKDVETLAAIKIQTAYRGYLARKALRALKGFVRLQAIIRGRAVRRQAMTTFKCLQAIVNIQSQVCNKRGQMAQGKYTHLQLHGHHDGNLKVEINMHRRLDGRLLPKEEEIGSIIEERKELSSCKQRSKAHSLTHRISSDTEESKSEGQLRSWLEQYVNDQVITNREHKNVVQHLKLRNRECSLNKLSIRRRSFHTQRKQSCSESIGLNPGDPTGIPTYMAATESARAKARSTSTPRLRPVIVERAYSDGDSPYKHKLVSPMSSTRSEMTCSGFSRVTNRSSCSLQKPPSFKGLHS